MRADPLSLNVSGQWLFSVADPPNFKDYLQVSTPRRLLRWVPSSGPSFRRPRVPPAARASQFRTLLFRRVPSPTSFIRLGSSVEHPGRRLSQRVPLHCAYPLPSHDSDGAREAFLCGSRRAQQLASFSRTIPTPPQCAFCLSGNISVAYNSPVPDHCSAQIPTLRGFNV